MNIQHLGDAYDHWKGSVISILSSRKKIGSNLVVVPMLTDFQLWKAKDLRTYRRLLNLREESTICHEHETFTNHQIGRHNYFAGIPNKCDLFLDPDTGISTGNHLTEKHITINEISNLLNDGGNRDRVLMVYQHSTRSRDRFPKIGSMLRRVPYYPFKCGQVAMFFISLSKNRIKAIKNTLRDYQKQA